MTPQVGCNAARVTSQTMPVVQNEADYEVLMAAERAGDLTVASGV
jgi:hypothetical protein